MTKEQRDKKRWKRENRQIKGLAQGREPHCAKCGHKLTRYGCPYCQPNILNVGLYNMRKGLMTEPALALTMAAIGRRHV